MSTSLKRQLADAREVLLEMDKIVAGHVAEVDRLREANKVLEAELRVTKALASQTLGEIGTDYRDLRALNAEMLAALRNLTNEVTGLWSAFGIDLRVVISHTNYACVVEKLEAANTVISKAEGQS